MLTNASLDLRQDLYFSKIKCPSPTTGLETFLGFFPHFPPISGAVFTQSYKYD